MLDLSKEISKQVAEKVNLLSSSIIVQKEKHSILYETSLLDVLDDRVKIGIPKEISVSELEQVKKILKSLAPWRKGPWDFFGIGLDAEWNSALKWSRIKENIDFLDGKRICDIGANNGYYMFKMLEGNPELVVGLEPASKVLLQYFLVLSFLSKELKEKLPLEMIPYGFEFLDHLDSCFDIIFCLGVLYHHQDPLSILQKIYKALDKKGVCIIETMGIPGKEPTALFPGVKYQGSRGFWFIPTEACLISWLKKCNFQNINVFYNEELSVDEQSKTSWSLYNSFEDGIKFNQGKMVTIEGYPLQRRIYVSCTR